MSTCSKKFLFIILGRPKKTAQIKVVTSIQIHFKSSQKRGKKKISSFLQTQGKMISFAIGFKAQSFAIDLKPKKTSKQMNKQKMKSTEQTIYLAYNGAL